MLKCCIDAFDELDRQALGVGVGVGRLDLGPRPRQRQRRRRQPHMLADILFAIMGNDARQLTPLVSIRAISTAQQKSCPIIVVKKTMVAPIRKLPRFQRFILIANQRTSMGFASRLFICVTH